MHHFGVVNYQVVHYVKIMARKVSGTPKSFRFSDDELKLLQRCAKRNKGMKPAIIAGLKLLDGQNETDWPAELRRLAAEIEGGEA